MQTHRVVIWEPRGTACTPLSFGLKEQVDDIEAILRQEAISSCHLIGWCTGPKVAVEFYLRHPQLVESMVFLNSQFKVSGTPRELITAYERNIEPLFHVLESNPTMASSVMKSLQTNLGGRKLNLFEQRDSQKLAREVLSAVNQDLKAHMLGPYQSESSTLNYAKQIIDFWSCDTLSKAGQVPVPILLVAAEYDQIAAPAMSHMARQHFPRASHVQVQGATHYLLYDRPDFLAGLIEDFFES
jgi:pimeloyl-ACP methyl ester carboxylesterase